PRTTFDTRFRRCCMRAGSVLIVAAWVLVSGTSLAQEKAQKDDGAARKDLAALQGSWEIVGKEFLGKKATKEEIAKLKGEMVIKGDKVAQWAEEIGEKLLLSKATLKLNPTARPKALDLTYTDGVLKGKTVLAIYEVQGDTLRVCYSLLDEQ